MIQWIIYKDSLLRPPAGCNLQKESKCKISHYNVSDNTCCVYVIDIAYILKLAFLVITCVKQTCIRIADWWILLKCMSLSSDDICIWSISAELENCGMRFESWSKHFSLTSLYLPQALSRPHQCHSAHRPILSLAVCLFLLPDGDRTL